MTNIRNIPVGKILITGDNPRKEFNLESLNLLGDSIQSHGLLQPIIVRPKEDYYELVVGERRLRATQLKEIFEIEARIEDLDDATCMEFRLIENTQREDLTESEKGDAVYALMEKYPERYPTMKDVAKSIQMPADTIYKWTRKSRKVSEHVKALTGLGKLLEDHVATLLKYAHPIQDKLADIIIKHKLNTEHMRKLAILYDENPFSNIDELAKEVKGIKIVRIEMETLSYEARNEVKVILDKKKKDTERKRIESLKKARTATRISKKKIEPKALEKIKAVKAVASEELKQVVTEEMAQEALRRKLEKPKIINPRSSQLYRARSYQEQALIPKLDELELPLSVEAKLTNKIRNPVKRFELGKTIKDQGFEEWETNKLLDLATYRPDLSLEELTEKVNVASKKRKEKKFLMLEVPHKIWEAIDAEAMKRKGPMGRLEIKETAIELLDERLKELGHNTASERAG